MPRSDAPGELRVILVYVLRLGCVAFAAWIALVPAALPGAHPVTRGGLAATLLVLSILIAEVDKLRMQFDALLRALRQATGRAGEPATSDEAVPILIRALESRDADVREKAHRNLVRLTGQDLPADRAAWDAWWRSRDATGEEAPRA